MLRISCRDLRDTDVMSKSDPLVAVYVSREPGEKKWTEVILARLHDLATEDRLFSDPKGLWILIFIGSITLDCMVCVYTPTYL